MKISFKFKIIIFGFSFLILPFLASAQEVVFNIDQNYDNQGRKDVAAVLVGDFDKLYFYVDKDWWQPLSFSEKQSLEVVFRNLSVEFQDRIHPELTSVFGQEPRPGVDGSDKITVLIHPMVREAGGYFNSGDVYSRLQSSRSNERNMVYLNSRYIDGEDAKVFLAHEFFHLITANQKDLLRNVTEELWLNEARAEYSTTFLGYDDEFKGSTLERRVARFLQSPETSLTEWLNRPEDYGVVNLFTQYLAGHYGTEILVDSLQSSTVGIPSVNLALSQNNYEKDFVDVFGDWLIAVLVNNCELGERYCYLQEPLDDLRVSPTFFHVPSTETALLTQHDTTYWTPKWQRFIGGAEGNFSLSFRGDSRVEFEVPYLLCDAEDMCRVGALSLDNQQTGEIFIENFGANYNSLTIMPFVKSKTSGFNGREGVFSFSWEIVSESQNETGQRAKLLAQIAELQEQVRQLKAQLAALRGETAECSRLESNLYFGMRNSLEVRCLQEFLSSQEGIYPEGLVTGNFLALTRQAVARFQERYADEILAPLNLAGGTGYVGPMTRIKINQLLGY